MHVGKGIFIQNLGNSTRSDEQTLKLEMELAVAAEDQGFGSVWTSEHHFTGYHMVPGVTQILTYLAARTTRVRLGSMVIVLPWQEPTRIAEELAVLDNLSDGRLVLGLGRGLGKVEFDALRLDMGQSRELFTEYSEALIDAFDTGVIEHQGALYKQPPTPLRPAPIAPLRGRTYASAVSPSSLDLMIKLGFGILVNGQKPWDLTEKEVKAYHDRFVEINGYEPPKPLLVSFTAVHESEAAAQEMYEEYIVPNARSTVDHYEFDNTAIADIPGYEYYGNVARSIAKHGRETFIRFLADLQVWGTPDQVTEQITSHIRRLDGAGVIANLSFGDMPTHTACANQDLFARSVLPQLSGVDPQRDIPSRPREIAVPTARPA
ncbi:MAG TPA: LLM class flavin-dependent oxidoreductase [Pseudonocardia sp.]|nr:LLM class flavin-dependent oxidoreductase [Pseudonocardia sp.]